MIHLKASFSTLLLILITVGCATTANNPDPYESVNRKVYGFNKAIDKAVLKPVAQGYNWLVPKPVDARIDSFFANLTELKVVSNDLLQAKFKQGWLDFSRFGINSTLGVLGLFDVASQWGLEKHEEDLGQTLAVWGWHDSTYLMLPFLGPSTTRDLGGRVGDAMTTGWSQAVDSKKAVIGLMALDVVNTRAGLFDAEKLMQESLDEYQYLRDAYLQRREYQVYDGEVPELVDPDEPEAQ